MMKWRLFAVAACAVLPTLISLGYNEIAVRQTYVDDIYREALRGSRQSEFEIEQIIDEVGSVLYATSTIKAVAEHDGSDCTDMLQRMVGGYPAVTSIFMIGLDGRILCSSDIKLNGKTVAVQSYFLRAISTAMRAVGELARDPVSGEFELPVAIPVRMPDGRIAGVLAAEMKMSWLDARISERGVAKGAALTIADREGYIIARNPYPERFVGTRIPDAYMSVVRSDRPGTMAVMSQDGTPRILGYQPSNAGTLGLYVSSGVSETEAFALVDRITLSGVLAIIGGIAFGLAAAWFIGNRFIYRPIRHIVVTIDAWRSGAIHVRTQLKRGDGDLGEIGEALDEFIAELAVTREASRRAQAHRVLLMHELGHRVKNTLTIAVGIANQMFRNFPDERDAFSQRLMALAGGYDLLLADNWTTADMGGVVHKTLAPHLQAEDQLDARGPACNLPSQLVLSLSLALHELATNAVKYGSLSRPTGRLRIDWTLKSDDPNIIVLTWTEIGGPPVTPPTRQGFGSKLLVRAFQAQFQSRIDFDYAVDGLKCRIEFKIPSQSEDVADLMPHVSA